MKKTLILSLLAFGLATTMFAQNSVMDFYNAKLQEVKDTPKFNENDPGFTLNIVTKDVANGYVKYDYKPALGYMIGVVESPEEMAYFISKNGRKLVGIVSSSKLQTEQNVYRWDYELPKFYELQNGQLVDKTEKYFPKSLSNQIEKLLESKRSQYAGINTWVKLPQVGLNIQIGVFAAAQSGFVPVVVGELQFNATDGTFKFVEK